jgi:Tol biopolymer transport system component
MLRNRRSGKGRTVRRAVLAVLLASGMPGLAVAAQIELVSRAPWRRAPETAGASLLLGRSPLSADGRYFVFSSEAPNLVPGQTDANAGVDVFLYDRLQGTTVLVSHAAGSTSTTADESSTGPVISADGGYIAFVSSARDLIPGLEDNPLARRNVFLYERATGKITLVSRRAGSERPANDTSEGPLLSADGSYLGFTSAATDLIPGLLRESLSANVFLYERASRTTTLVSRRGSSALQTGNGSAALGALSADGRYLAFSSLATDHVSGQTDSKGTVDVFLFDRLAGASTLVSHLSGSSLTTGNAGSDSPSLSADGRYLAFSSGATNLVSGVNDDNFRPDVFLYDRLLGTVSLVSRSADSPNAVNPIGGGPPFISEDGGTIAYFEEELGRLQSALFVFDRLAGSTTLVSPSIEGSLTPPIEVRDDVSLSGNGRYMAYTRLSALANGFGSRDIFLLDRTSGVTVLVSHADGLPGKVGNSPSVVPALSADGSWLAFVSLASDLAAGKRDSNLAPDVFLHERATGANRVVSLHPPGMASLTSLGRSQAPSVSGDGRYVAFVSEAVGLFPGHVDLNRASDVFLYDRVSKRTALVSRSNASLARSANAASISPIVSRDGNYVLFASGATDLVAGQQNPAGTFNVFLFDRRTGTATLVSRSRESPVQTANGSSIAGGVSADGNVVAFTSLATDLVGEEDSNGIFDVFWFDRRTGTVTLVSKASSSGTGRTGNSSSFFSSMTPDGAFIAFGSGATDLVPEVEDTNEEGEAFLYQRSSGKVTLLSRDRGTSGPASTGEHPIVSANGRYAALISRISRNVVLLDRVSGKTFQLGPTHAPPGVAPDLSDNGRYVLFSSERADLIPGQDDDNGEPDLFLFNRISGKTSLVSHVPGSPLQTGERGVFQGRLSADGRYVTFVSGAQDLVPEPTRFLANVFLYDRRSEDVTLVSRSALSPSRASNGSSLEPAISASGGFVAFSSFASDLVTGDFNGVNLDVFLYVPGEE